MTRRLVEAAEAYGRHKRCESISDKECRDIVDMLEVVRAFAQAEGGSALALLVSMELSSYTGYVKARKEMKR